jgi:hypothetical protein
MSVAFTSVPAEQKQADPTHHSTHTSSNIFKSLPKTETQISVSTGFIKNSAASVPVQESKG